jgi:hypothetical protein
MLSYTYAFVGCVKRTILNYGYLLNLFTFFNYLLSGIGNW